MSRTNLPHPEERPAGASRRTQHTDSAPRGCRWSGRDDLVCCAPPNAECGGRPMSVSETIAARPGPPLPSRRLIDGPSAWVGADMRKREAEWSYRLSPAEIAEIEAALSAVRE